jgi:hypothetical protein
MSLSNASETAFLNLLFKNLAWANVGDAGGLPPSAAAGSFFVRLHTADPGEAGTGDTNEAAYTGYAPVAVARGAGFNVVGNVVSNAGAVTFGECTAGTSVVTHFSVCVGSGAGAAIIYRGALAASRTITAGITPLFNAGALTGTVD